MPQILLNKQPDSSKSLDGKSNFSNPTILKLNAEAAELNHIDILRGDRKYIEEGRILYVMYNTLNGQSRLLHYIQTICEKRQLYSDGVCIVNCSTYKPDGLRSRTMEHDLS